MEDCIFCKIISNEIPSYKIYEDDLALAILDINPLSKGHVLIIPKKHAKDIFEIEENYLERIILIAKKVAKKIKDVLGVDGVNFYHASGIHAEQSVFHFHLHVIPRRKDDNISFNGVATGKEIFSEDEYKEVAAKLKIEV
ncbi:MAG: HIT domain-containing protein [Candidatus Paceibacterota bacterium]|jgi:histidine triad (HIT) family protein